MSEKDVTAAVFNERELQMLGWAMQALKSGPPDVDYDKLAALAGMTNSGSARNAWTKIKVKLFSGVDGVAPVPTLKQGGGRKKTAAKKVSNDGEGEEIDEAPIKKVPRKRVSKKQEVDDEESPPPKKKASASPRKKATKGFKAINSEDFVSEDDESSDQASTDVVKSEAVEDTTAAEENGEQHTEL